jgi:RIO kinase 1
LTGRYTAPTRTVDMASVVREIDDAKAEEAARRLRMQGPGPR